MATTENKVGPSYDWAGRVGPVSVEGLNPPVSCGFSRSQAEMPEQHSPAEVSDPFTSTFVEKRLDTANPGL